MRLVFFLFVLWVSPIFFCLDCGFVMCYGIHETTTKPDVLSNASIYSFNTFAEVELRECRVVGVKTLCRLSFLVKLLLLYSSSQNNPPPIG